MELRTDFTFIFDDIAMSEWEEIALTVTNRGCLTFFQNTVRHDERFFI